MNPFVLLGLGAVGFVVMRAAKDIHNPEPATVSTLAGKQYLYHMEIRPPLDDAGIAGLKQSLTASGASDFSVHQTGPVQMLTYRMRPVVNVVVKLNDPIRISLGPLSVEARFISVTETV